MYKLDIKSLANKLLFNNSKGTNNTNNTNLEVTTTTISKLAQKPTIY